MAELVAKYQQYEEYKDSGIEWLGEIPKDWKAIKVKYIADTVSTGGTPKDLSSFTLEPEVCWFTPGDFHDGQILRQANKYVTWKSVNTNDAKIYKENSVLVIGIGATLGKVAHCSIPFSCNQQINVITPNNNISSFFLMYSLLVQNEQMSLSSNASTIGIMNQEKTKDILLALPSLKEQKTVTNFLDHETAQIDTLIDKQQTLIQLLKEKRQAVISHAVTKGLNPDAPMKDSGVEWLGEVPEHWVVTKFSHCAQIRNGLVDPKAPDFKNLVLYAPNHIEKGTGKIVYKETAEEQGADSSKYLCYKGEVIYSKIRPALAKVAICEEETALCSADMYPINAVNGLDNRFLYFFMLSDNFTKAAILDSDRVAMPKINRESLSDYRLPVPPVIEQMEICRFIADQNTKLEELESKAIKAIQLMQERRTALISAAVTGKIDVRGWVAPESR
ncbi:MAG: restriction endonuclease subunit S [Psychrobacter sp.]